MVKKFKRVLFVVAALFVLYLLFPNMIIGPDLSGDGGGYSISMSPSASGGAYAHRTSSAPGAKPCVNLATGHANPLADMYVARASSGRLESGRFGKTRNGGTTEHHGIDLAAEPGTPVYAMCDGVVESQPYLNTAVDGDTEAGGGYGNKVSIQGVIGGETVSVFYAHLQNGGLTVRPGDHVTKGQLIGYTGQTGNAWGAGVPNKHLHLEIRKGGTAVDPEPYLNGEVAPDGSFAGIICD